MMTSPKAVNSGQTEREAFEQIARRIHYPACWDTAAYPTLASALVECAAWYDLRCGECEDGSIVRAASTATATGEREIWEYSFIHSSALGRPDEKVTLLTYDKDTAFKSTCFDQKLVCSAGVAIAEVCQDADGFKHIAEIVEELDDIPTGTRLYALALAEQSAASTATAAPQTDAEALYDAWQSTFDHMDARRAAAPQGLTIEQREAVEYAQQVLRQVEAGDGTFVGQCTDAINGLDALLAEQSPAPASPSGEDAAEQADASMADEWKLAVDHELVTIDSTADSFASPREALNALIQWHVAVALDPAVSKDAQALIDRGAAAPQGLTDERILELARKWGMFASGIQQIQGFARDVFAEQSAAPMAASPQAPAVDGAEAVAIYHGTGIIDCGDHGHHNLELLKLIPAGSKLYLRPLTREAATVTEGWKLTMYALSEAISLLYPPKQPTEKFSKMVEQARIAYHDALAAESTTLPRASEQADEAVTDAARDVLAERQRQVTAEGWTTAHDDEHDCGQLAGAASCYAAHVNGRQWVFFDGRHDDYKSEPTPDYWPWDESWWKPTTPRRDLVKAGALILAEIERLDRATHAKEPK